MKTCIRCKFKKQDEEFYKHPKMADGRLGKCKECCKSQSKARIRRKRKDPEWVKLERVRCREKAALSRRLGPSKQPPNSVKHDWRRRNKLKSNAHRIAALAVKSGILKPKKRCEDCNKRRKLSKHHEDHSKPLQVEWLCSKCHGKRHRIDRG